MEVDVVTAKGEHWKALASLVVQDTKYDIYTCVLFEQASSVLLCHLGPQLVSMKPPN